MARNLQTYTRNPFDNLQSDHQEEDTENALYDNPQFSSASQCIRFKLLDAALFSPVFTHQIFHDEWIRGYQPMVAYHALLADPNQRQIKSHRSFVHHILASHELRIHIELAPDCASCQVKIQTRSLEDSNNNRAIHKRSRSSMSRLRRRSSVEASSRIKLLSQDNDHEYNDDDELRHDDNEDEKSHPTPTHQSIHKSKADANHSAAHSSSDDDPDDIYHHESDDQGDDRSGESDNDDDDSSSLLQNRDEDDVSPVRRLEISDIRDLLALGLPPMVSCAAKDIELPTITAASNQSPSNRPVRQCRSPSPKRKVVVQAVPQLTSFLDEPVGKVIKEYTVKNMNFVLSLATNKEATMTYHNSIQRLATWFIETAENVDIGCSKDGGYWKVLYLFRRHDSQLLSFVGYTTLYHFHSPFRKPRPGTVVRVCQALVLPPYQRMGHGAHFLNAVYDLAHNKYNNNSNRNNSRAETNAAAGGGSSRNSSSISKRQKTNIAEIVEINVENPGPAFTALRNFVDYSRFGHHPSFHDGDDNNGGSVAITHEAFFAGLSDAQAIALSTELKITTAQVHVVYDLVKLRALLHFFQGHEAADVHHNDNAASTAVGERLEKEYRLMVKKRLNKLHREELCAPGRTKSETQRLLASLYDTLRAGYEQLLLSHRL